MNSDLLNWPTIINFDKHDIWQTMLDSCPYQVLEKQNVRFQVGICPEKFKLDQKSKGPIIGHT